MRLVTRALAFAGALLLCSVGTAASSQSVVHLRANQASCDTVTETCFTDTELLTAWLWNGGRDPAPSANDRVLVLVGPGDFDYFVCDSTGATDQGYVSVIGAGREQTRFIANSGDTPQFAPYCAGGISVYSCNSMTFQDLTAYGSHTGVIWQGGGSATWTDVDMIAGGSGPIYPGSSETVFAGICPGNGDTALGWYDIGSVESTHYLFGSRAVARGRVDNGLNWRLNLAWDGVSPAKIWWYGGEIVAEPQVAGPYNMQAAVRIGRGQRMHLFGTSVRSKTGVATSTTFTDQFQGVRVHDPPKVDLGTQFHMHGGIIVADSSCPPSQDCSQAPDVPANAVSVTSGEFAHLMGTTFDVKARGSGVARRLAGSPDDIEGPFIWHAGSTPPLTDTTNTNAQDIFVDTAAGPGNNEAHVMVYDCPATGGGCCTGPGGPWRDMADKVGDTCRQP